MTMLVDTSVWSLAFRRDAPASGPEVRALRAAIDAGDVIVTTGLVLQELLQGFAGPRAGKDIVQRFAALPLLVPDRQDYMDAAGIRNVCRRAGRILSDGLPPPYCFHQHASVVWEKAHCRSLHFAAPDFL